MKQIALVSIAYNAVNPMTNYLSSIEGVRAVNYLDSYIQEKVRKEGITDASMRRMVNMISSACEDGADGIIITCTMFSPYVDQFRRLFSVPIVGADVAMMEKVGKKGGSSLILCTFASTAKPSEKLLRSMYEKYKNPCSIETILLEEAADAAGRLDMKEHNRVILEAVSANDKKYDNIVLAQISMSQAVFGYESVHAQVFTSPKAAYEALFGQA